MAVIGGSLVVIVVFLALAAPIVSPFSPLERVGPINGPPTSTNILGTDRLGRDVLTRVIYGARASLIVGVGAETLSLAIGVVVGTLAGFRGGTTDVLLMRLVDVFMAFPFILLAIMVVTAIGPGLINVVFALGATSWTGTARLLRGEVLRLREEPYVEAARSIGASDTRIILSHIARNFAPMLITLSSIGIGSAIIGESSLSFLGLGITPPTPSWGLDLAFGRLEILARPFLTIGPVVGIFVTVLGFNLLGDGLRNALDPREATRIT